MSLSNFVPNPNGPGGTISIYLSGQIVATWNGTKDNGDLIPNGFYHFVLVEHLGDGNTVQLERDAFISTYHGEAISLVAWPNITHPGQTVTFNASFAGTPVDSQSKMKIYSADGELVQTIAFTTGTALWNAKNLSGQMVASGVYLAVLDGVDPLSGQSLTKVVKVLVTH